MKQEFDFLDDFLKQKVESTHFGMKEEYWDKMSALLDEEDKKKKRGFPFWRGLSVLFLLIATGIGAYVVPKFVTKRSKAETETRFEQREATQTVSSHTLGESNTAPVMNSSNASDEPTQSLSNSTTRSSSPIESISAPTQTTQASTHPTNTSNVSTANETAIHTGNVSPSIRSQAISISQNMNASNQNTNSSFVSSTTTEESNSSDSPKKLKSHHHKTSIQKNPEVVALALTSSEQTKVKKNKISRHHSNQSHANNLSISGSSTKENQTTTAVSPTHDATVNQPNLVESGSHSATSTTPSGVHYNNGIAYQPVDTQVRSSRRILSPEESNPRYRADLLQYKPEYMELVTIITSKPLTDNTANGTTSSENKPIPDITLTEEQKKEWSRRLQLFAMAGMNINKGLKGDAESSVKMGISPFVGFGIEKPLSSELSVSAAFGYTYFNGLNQVKRDNYYTYSFGVDSTLQSYYTKKLYQLYLPISLTYHLSSRQHFTAGMGVTYSFGTSGVIQEDLYKAMVNPTGIPTTPNKSSTTVTPITASNTGFQTFDFFLQAGYSYEVVKRLYAQVMMQQGFMDISKNSYYNNGVNNTLTRFSVGVRYNLPSFIKK